MKMVTKKNGATALWDMDNTFDHGANYTGIPNNGPDADPCDPESIRVMSVVKVIYLYGML